MNKTVLLIFIISIAIRIGFLFVPQDMWHDASFSVLFAQEHVSYILNSNDVHPPLYYLGLKLALLLSKNELFIRSTSIAAWGLFYAFAYLFLAKTLKRPAIEITMWLLAISPTMVYYSLEPRNYMIGMAFVAAQLYYYFSKKPAKFAIASVLMLYTHYFTAFVLVVELIYSYKAKWFWKPLTIIGLSALPLAFYFLRTLPKMYSMWFKPIGLMSLASTFAYQFIIPDISYDIATLVLIFPISTIIIALIYRNRINIFYLLLFIIPVLLMFAVSQWVIIYHHRFFLFYSIGLYAIIANAVVQVSFKYAYMAITLLSALLVFGLIIMPGYLPHELKDSSKTITDSRPIYHLSPFSQTPYKFYLPDNPNYLVTNLTKQQRFTAGGAIIHDWEIKASIPRNSTIVSDSQSCIKCYQAVNDSKLIKELCVFCSDQILYNQGGLIVYEN